MTTAWLRRLAYFALTVAFVHLVFGAIVRISGSGMGCGNHWPTCYGRWFPPLDQPTLVIEWTHRLLAAVLTMTVLGLAAAAWARRAEPGVGGERGILRSAALAAVLVVVTALFGALTVKLGNAPLATVGHWLLAATLLATLAATVVRAGGLGAGGLGASALGAGGFSTGGLSARGTGELNGRVARAAFAGATLALVVVLLGGLTAKVPGANVACTGFPLCGNQLSTPAYVQLTHRVLAFLLAFHVVATAIAATRRGVNVAVLRPLQIAAALVLLQIGIAAAMVALSLPPALRSLHQATGVALWLTLFTAAYMAKSARYARQAPSRDLAGTVRTRGADLPGVPSGVAS